MMYRSLLGLMLASVLVQAVAADYRVDAPVRSAVLYRNMAEVTRKVEVHIDSAGIHHIIVPYALAQYADAVHPQIHGAVLLGISRMPDWQRPMSPLQKQLETLQLKLDANQQAMQGLAALRQGLGEQLGHGGTYDEVRSHLATVEADYATLNAARTQLKRQQGLLEAQEKWQSQGKRNEPAQVLVFSVQTKQAATVTLTWQARTELASWQPTSDWYLDTQKGRLDISAQAKMTQQTGMDWSDVALTLAVVPPEYVARPELQPQTLQLQDRKEKRRDLPTPMALMARADFATTEAGDANMAAEVIQSGVDFRANLPSTYDLPSNVDGRSTTYWQHEVKADIYSAVFDWIWPRNTALLLARWTMPQGINLLPGKMTLYRDGNVITQGYELPAMLRAGSQQTLSFGDDPQLLVSIHHPPGYTEEHGLLHRAHALSERTSVDIVNQGVQAKPVYLYSRLPVSTAEAISVTPVWSPKPSEQHADDIKGLTLWKNSLKPQEKWHVETGFDIEYPEGKVLLGL